MKVRGEHEIYCCGSRVRISGKGVEVLTEPTVGYCPLHKTLYGAENIDRQSVRKSVETKISGYGFCSRNRLFNAESIVAYGASEMMQVRLEQDLVDCAVVVCEGAGTVITANAKLVQAVDARLTGIVKTSPIREIVGHIEKEGGIILDKTEARIDQFEGVKRASDLGFKRVAVSVAGFQTQAISDIREFESSSDVNVLVFSVCNTCVRYANVRHIAKADIVCASASKIVRAQIANKALVQLGMTIPVYALTEKGKRLVLAYLAEFDHKLVIFRTVKLPYLAERKGPTLKSQTKRS